MLPPEEGSLHEVEGLGEGDCSRHAGSHEHASPEQRAEHQAGLALRILRWLHTLIIYSYIYLL